VLLKQPATIMPMVMDSKNAENDYAGLITTQTINIYNKDNDKYYQMFVCVCEDTLQWQNVFNTAKFLGADPSGRALEGAGLRPRACWECGSNLTGGMYFYLLLVLCVVR